MGPSTFFLDCVSALKVEDLVKRSPKGGPVGGVLEYIETMDKKGMIELSESLTSALIRCLNAGSARKLPSAAQAKVWSEFHSMRSGEQIKATWFSFIPSPFKEVTLTLQLLLDRMLKRMISMRAKSVADSFHTSIGYVKPLTKFENNAIRYMAGYVPVHLLKQYERPSKNEKLTFKRQLFAQVLHSMKASNQPGVPGPVSIHAYTTQWSELVDRGGLFHIKDEVYLLMVKIEYVFRWHFNKESISRYAIGRNLRDVVCLEVLCSQPILSCWENIANCIAAKYSAYSLELLGAITNLWITVGGHAFAKGWMNKFQKKYKRKGTRKELKPKNDDDS